MKLQTFRRDAAAGLATAQGKLAAAEAKIAELEFDRRLALAESDAIEPVAAIDKAIAEQRQAAATYADRVQVLKAAVREHQAEQNLPWVPSGGFGTIADFARVVGNLYELRNLADYDPPRDFTPDEARVAISDVQQAIVWFQQGTKEQQEAFLTLLLFKSR